MKDFYEFEDCHLVNLHKMCSLDLANAFMLSILHGDGELVEAGKVYFRDEEHLIRFMETICRRK